MQDKALTYLCIHVMKVVEDASPKPKLWKELLV